MPSPSEQMESLIEAEMNYSTAQAFANKALAGCKAGEVTVSDLDAANRAACRAKMDFDIEAANAREALKLAHKIAEAARDNQVKGAKWVERSFDGDAPLSELEMLENESDAAGERLDALLAKYWASA